MPTPRYATPVSTMPGRFAGRGPTDSAGADTTTEETVQGVGPNSLYLILGYEVPTRTSLQLDTGDRVLVRWHKALPVLILEVRSRRGPGVDEPVGGGGVEELLQAPPEAVTGGPFPDTDIWFRNRNRIDLLDVRGLLGVPSVGFGVSRGWGAQRRQFLLSDTMSPISAGLSGNIHVVQPGRALFYAIKLSGSPTTEFTSKPKATLAQTIDAGASNLVIGTFTLIDTGPGGGRGPFSQTVKLGRALSTGYEMFIVPGGGGLTEFGSGGVTDTIITAYATDAYLNAAGEMIATFTVGLLDVASSSVTRLWSWPIVVNLTQNIFIYNGVRNPVGGIAGLDNSLDGTNLDLNALAEPDPFTKFNPEIHLRPLANARGQAIAAVVWVYYPRFLGTNYFAAYLCSCIEGNVSVVREIVSFRPLTLDIHGHERDDLWTIGSNQRYVFWSYILQATTNFTLPADMGPIHITDFTGAGMPDAEATDADGALPFVSFDPVPMSPSLLYLLNPPPADVTTTDTRNAFAKFRDGATIAISQPPTTLPGSLSAASLKSFSGASAHIPAYFEDHVESFSVDKTSNNLALFLKYQLIPGGNFDPPQR